MDTGKCCDYIKGSLTPNLDYLKVLVTGATLKRFEKERSDLSLTGTNPFLRFENRRALIDYLQTVKPKPEKRKRKPRFYKTLTTKIFPLTEEPHSGLLPICKNPYGNGVYYRSGVLTNKKTYFDGDILLTDLLNANLKSPPEHPSELEVTSLRRFVEKYGIALIEFDLSRPLDKRPDYFFMLKNHILALQKVYNLYDKNKKKFPKLKRPKDTSRKSQNEWGQNVYIYLKTHDSALKRVDQKKLRQYETERAAGRPDVVWASEIAPKALVDLAHLQINKSYEGGAKYKRCPRCGCWFTLTHPNRKYCSDLCSGAFRTARFRQRKAPKK